MKTLEDRRINLMARVARAQRDHKNSESLQRELTDLTTRLLAKLIGFRPRRKRSA